MKTVSAFLLASQGWKEISDQTSGKKRKKEGTAATSFIILVERNLALRVTDQGKGEKKKESQEGDGNRKKPTHKEDNHPEGTKGRAEGGSHAP